MASGLNTITRGIPDKTGATQRAIRALDEAINLRELRITDLEETVNNLTVGVGAVNSVTAGNSMIQVSPTSGDVVVSLIPANITGLPQSAVTNLVSDLAGKIDEVIAGTNLSGGGSSGSVTLDVVASPSFAGNVTLGDTGADAHTVNGALTSITGVNHLGAIRGNVITTTFGATFMDGISPAGLSNATAVVVTSATGFTYISGIDSTGVSDGRVLWFINRSGQTLWFLHQHGGFITPVPVADRLITYGAASDYIDGVGAIGFMYRTGAGWIEIARVSSMFNGMTNNGALTQVGAASLFSTLTVSGDTTIAGTLGVGGGTYSEQLHVTKTVAGAIGAVIEHQGAGNNAAFVEAKDSSGRRIRMQANGSGANPYIGTITSQNLNIVTGNTEMAQFDTTGGLLLTRTAGTTFVSFTNGSSAGVSAANAGRLRYNTTGQVFQVSQNGAAYVPLVGGSGTTSRTVRFTGTNTIGNGSATDNGTNISAAADNSYIAWDSGGNDRLGFTKKSGFAPKLTYGSATDFVIAQSSTSSIAAGSTYTDKFTITAGGAIGLTGNTTITGNEAVTGTLQVTGITTLNDDVNVNGDELLAPSARVRFLGGTVSLGDPTLYVDGTISGYGLRVVSDTTLEKTTVSKAFHTSGIITGSISGDVDDWAPTGHAAAVLVRIETTMLNPEPPALAGAVISGFEAGSNPAGRHLYLEYTGDDEVTISHQDAGSTSVNQFYLKDGSNVVMTGTAQALHFIHTGSYWLHVGSN